MFLTKLSYQKWFFFQFYSFWLILFKYPYCNHIVIVKVIMITGCFAMYSITITITCNNKNQRLQITFRLLKTCNWLHVIMITDYNYNRPAGDQEVAGSTPAEVGNILSWRLIMKYFLRSFSPFRWFKKGSCQFLAKECAQYWLTAWRTKPAQ